MENQISHPTCLYHWAPLSNCSPNCRGYGIEVKRSLHPNPANITHLSEAQYPRRGYAAS